jgi:hypothetical protein
VKRPGKTDPAAGELNPLGVNNNMWKRILIIVIILPIVGCLFGYVIADIQYGQHNITWEYLGTPPSPAIQFVDNVKGIVVVSTSNGQIYTYVPYDKWRLIDEDRLETRVEDFSELCKDVTAPPLEGTIDSMEDCARFEMGSAYYKYVIIEDGSIWMWSKTINMYGLSYLFYMAIGSFGLLVLGLITIVIMRILNRKNVGTNIDT